MGYDFDERLSPNEFHEIGRLAPSIVNGDSCPADQFPTLDPEREPIQFDRVETLSAERVARRLDVQSSKAAEKKVIIVESRIFLRECIQRSIQSALSIPVEMLSSFSELDDQRTIGSARLVIICLDETNTQESAEALGIIADLAPTLPTIVLSSKYDFEVMRAVIGCGAKGYIPMTMGFEITVEAVRFVLAGGTYIPAECLLSAIPSAVAPVGLWRHHQPRTRRCPRDPSRQAEQDHRLRTEHVRKHCKSACSPYHEKTARQEPYGCGDQGNGPPCMFQMYDPKRMLVRWAVFDAIRLAACRT